MVLTYEYTQTVKKKKEENVLDAKNAGLFSECYLSRKRMEDVHC